MTKISYRSLKAAIEKGDKMSDAIVRAAPAPLATTEVPISAILANAVERGADIAVLERLVALHERVQASRAKEAFAMAMSAFKTECPPIPRRTENSQFKVNRNGVQVARKYAALEDIGATVRNPLGKHGLSFRWSDATVDGGVLKVSCVVSHVGGYSESSSAQVSIESKAGCSDQQKMGTAITYAQRYSLIAALGLTTCDEDTDGNAEPAEPAAKITDHQAANIEACLEDLKADRTKFLRVLGVESVADIPAGAFRVAMNLLESKRKAQA